MSSFFSFLKSAQDRDVIGPRIRPVKVGITVNNRDVQVQRQDIPSFNRPSSDQDSDSPTPEELANMRRVPGSVRVATYLIAFVELVERFSYYGTTVVFTNFIQRPLPPGSSTGAGGLQSGALGMGQRASTGITTFNSFWVYLCPLFGAYVADAHLGRYNTILISVLIALIGHLLLVVCALPSIIVQPTKCLAVFLIAIIIMGVGTGGFKSTISPLIAEQQEISHSHSKPSIRVLKSGEKVLVDPTLTTERIYLYFYLLISVGALAGQISMVYAEKYVGYWLSFLLPTILLLFCPLVLILGKRIYVLRPPTGSVFGQAMRLWHFAITKRWQVWRRQEDGRRAVEFWEAVKPSTLDRLGETKPRWMTFDDQRVEEVRRGFKACRVFLWFPVYWLTYIQMSNNFTSQAGTMNTHGLPNDILANLDPFALIILIPLFDRILYPGLRRAGINFITGGFLVGSLAMVCAAINQHYIYQRSQCGQFAGRAGCQPVDISVWAQTPSYILMAVAEILGSVTGMEYAFALAPKNMRSLVTSLFLFQSAISSAIGEAFNGLSDDPLLVWNYGTMAVISFLAGLGFWFTHRALDAEHDKLLRLPEGKHADTSHVFEEGCGSSARGKMDQHREMEGDELAEGETLMGNVSPPISPTQSVPKFKHTKVNQDDISSVGA